LTAQKLLLTWLKPRIDAQGFAWIEEKAKLLTAAAASDSQKTSSAPDRTSTPDRTVFTAFSSAVRHAGKELLNLNSNELKSAAAAVPDWKPSDWTCAEAARIALLLSLPATPEAARIIDQIYHTADMGEAATLQKALAVLANPEGHMAWAREGIRSNIQEVFEAICLRNPYPSLHFDEVGWNQMVVKTFFVGSPLHEVVGLDRRVNPALSRMLADLAHERWAAGRAFSPELWRCVGPCADARALEDLKKTLAQGSPVEKRAAALALLSCPDTHSAGILESDATLAAAVRGGKLTWENLYDGD